MITKAFSGQFHVVGAVPPLTTDSAIEAEPMLFSASPDFAYEKGGSLTRSVLDVLWKTHRGAIKKGYHWVIDTRSHMLMPEMIPAIPGWHCDGVMRPNDGNGQPDLNLMDPRVRHFTCHVATNIDVSRTEFLWQPFASVIDEKRVWGSLNVDIEKEKPTTHHSDHGAVVMFGQDVPHRATPSHARGWRWWFRMSEYDKAPINKIRHQVQVYATDKGW